MTKTPYPIDHWLYGQPEYITTFFEKLAAREDSEREFLKVITLITARAPDLIPAIQKAASPKETPQAQAIRLAAELQTILPLLVSRTEMVTKVDEASRSGAAKAQERLRHTLLNIGYQ